MNPNPALFGLRPMVPADLDAVLAMAAASPEAPRWKASDYAPYFASATPDPPLLRIAMAAASTDTAEEKVVGFAAASLLLDGQQNLCQLDSMAVHPDLRRHGAGTALLRAILAWAAQNGADHLSLEVRAGNTSAIHLYERLGLRPEGHRPRYYADPEEDALILGMPVTQVCNQADFH